MKKFIALIILFTMVFSSYVTYGSPPGFSGGVNNENEYEEIVFITGKPIKFVGEYKVKVNEKSGKKTITYTFNKLKPASLPVEAKMDKKIKITIEYDKNNDKGQTITNTTVDMDEKITIGNDEYQLENIQFSKSDIIDNRPASDFYTGNFTIRKQYTINKNQGKVVIEGTGTNVGYENFWGSTETQLIDYVIHYDRKIYRGDPKKEPNNYDEISWTGTVSIKTSDSATKSLQYWQNEAGLSSFNRGYIRVTNRDVVSEYSYNLPRMVRARYGYTVADTRLELPDESGKRNTGSEKLSKSMLPQVEHLIVPKFRDTGGHWAQDYIEKLYSLDVFEGESEFFVPEAPMTRQEFARAVVKACNIRLDSDTKTKPSSGRKASKDPVFTDVNSKDPDYEYIKEAVNKGIIQGQSDGTFAPGEPLTRAQAATIFIRALGFQNMAPNPGYFTYFNDDYDIPDWARDSIYMASEIGIIQGDEMGNINPNRDMTRAEASAMLIRFLEFLEKDLQKNYREEIIYYK